MIRQEKLHQRDTRLDEGMWEERKKCMEGDCKCRCSCAAFKTLDPL